MVERFNAEIWVTRGSETVGGTSIMGLMMLSAGPGTTITVSAAGPEAEAALDAITELVAASSTKKTRDRAVPRGRHLRRGESDYFPGGTI